ncbi:hypothetical protein VCHA50O407_30204 [Vibrio chagasii]|nr:hypothetical protein VCHA40P238_110129 [Vibrio chagasii]CAH7291522.1 hypothetical protein VCHA50O407_30204 [Vibrio chagasii]CAH7341326.1 hypothetical protein VCHA50P424_40098 [Vibrio chagasii]
MSYCSVFVKPMSNQFHSTRNPSYINKFDVVFKNYQFYLYRPTP